MKYMVPRPLFCPKTKLTIFQMKTRGTPITYDLTPIGSLASVSNTPFLHITAPASIEGPPNGLRTL